MPKDQMEPSLRILVLRSSLHRVGAHDQPWIYEPEASTRCHENNNAMRAPQEASIKSSTPGLG